MEPNENANASSAPETPETPEQPEARQEEVSLETALSADLPPPSDSTMIDGATEDEPASQSDLGAESRAASADDAAQTSAAPSLSLDEAVARAQVGRLSAADERATIEVLKNSLLAGKTGVSDAATVLPKFAWIVGVNAVTAAWPEMKATSRTQLLKALADEEQTDTIRRLRLSIARGLHKIGDPAAALKLGVSVAKEMWDKESGDILPKDAQIFDSAFLGKARPWCAQLSLGELKVGEADALVHCAVLSAFQLSHPPVTQLGVLKWAAESDRLSKLNPVAVAAIGRGISRWSGKWQNALRKEVPDLPDEITRALKPAAETTASEPGSDFASDAADVADDVETPAEPENVDSDEPREVRKERPVYISKTIPPREPREVAAPVPPPASATPAQPSSRAGSAKSINFNVADTLRQIESHVVWLKTELKAAEKRVRSRDEDPRRRRKPEATIIPGEPTAEELARLNVQLEDRITELQARIDDLTNDSESRAVSTGALTGENPPSPDDQLRMLLALKLQEDYADFLALEQESRDIVVQQHYRTLLQDVFEVLKAEGVRLAGDGQGSGAPA